MSIQVHSDAMGGKADHSRLADATLVKVVRGSLVLQNGRAEQLGLTDTQTLVATFPERESSGAQWICGCVADRGNAVPASDQEKLPSKVVNGWRAERRYSIIIAGVNIIHLR